VNSIRNLVGGSAIYFVEMTSCFICVW